MNIPVDDTKWHRILEADLPLPAGHYAEYTMSGGDMLVRIVGPNAHVTGNDVYLDKAIEYALEWFEAVGGEL